MKAIVAVGFILLLGVLSLIAYQQYENNQLVQRDRSDGQVAEIPQPTLVEVVDAIEKVGAEVKVNNQNSVVAVEFPTLTKITGALLGHLKRLPDLEVLFMEASSIKDDELKHLRGMSKLRALDLSVCYVSDAGMVHLENLPKLEMLRVNGTFVTDAGLVHLKKIKTLNMLDLGQAKNITNIGLSHLKNLTNLRALDLTAAKITDAGLVHLEGLKKLVRLDLSLTSITPAGVRQLRRALPGCDINEPVP